MFECETCTSTFWYQDDCEYHMDDHGHWPECETCPRVFRTNEFRDQHMNDTNHWGPRFECEICDRLFRSEASADQHMTNTGHWRPRFGCESCQKMFHSQGQATQHMNALGHWAPKIPCETCGLKFHTVASAEKHMQAQKHYKSYCPDCGVQFQNENNLKMVSFSFPWAAFVPNEFHKQHLNSKIHRGSQILCPFCKNKFTTGSGVAHHLERGSCPKAQGVNRETILHMIRKHDRGGFITNKQIEWHNNSQYSATNQAFNGYYWECYLCHKKFQKQPDLNRHFNSQAHKQKVYHCPNVRGRCMKQFTALAGIFNHLESESCAFMRFEKVQQQVNDVFQGRRLLGA